MQGLACGVNQTHMGNLEVPHQATAQAVASTVMKCEWQVCHCSPWYASCYCVHAQRLLVTCNVMLAAI